jgi:hypothetical protein
MNRRDVVDLLGLIERFVDGDEQTKPVAAEIEGLVIECFQDEPWFDDVSEALALFVPGGSTPYLDESALAGQLAPIAGELRTALQNTPKDA